VKPTVTTDSLFQVEEVTRMIESKEESKEELEKVKWAAQWVLEVIILMLGSCQLLDKLEQILWLINNHLKETLVVIPTNNMLELQKEAHKEQVWEEAEIELKNRTQVLLENQVGTLKKKVKRVQNLKKMSKKEVTELNTLREATVVPTISTTSQKMKSQLLAS